MDNQGQILVAWGNRGVVELASGERVECKFRRSVGRPHCGDRVSVVAADGESTVVTAIRPRRNEFMRANARQQKQVIATNLDQVVVVVAPAPEPSRDLVERYLVAVHSMGIDPVLVVNKMDLMAGANLSADSPLRRLDEYAKLGYTVLESCCKGPPGTMELERILKDRTSILVGQSGVGKSSLVNAVLPDLALQTGALSNVTGKGTHTTTTTIMYTLPCGGRLIDSPGVWEYGLWQMEQRELALGFPEFGPFTVNCRFNDCRHRSEPSCAVREAAQNGTLRDWRYQSYLRLLEQGGL